MNAGLRKFRPDPLWLPLTDVGGVHLWATITATRECHSFRRFGRTGGVATVVIGDASSTRPTSRRRRRGLRFPVPGPAAVPDEQALGRVRHREIIVETSSYARTPVAAE